MKLNIYIIFKWNLIFKYLYFLIFTNNLIYYLKIIWKKLISKNDKHKQIIITILNIILIDFPPLCPSNPPYPHHHHHLLSHLGFLKRGLLFAVHFSVQLQLHITHYHLIQIHLFVSLDLPLYQYLDYNFCI